MSRNDAIDDLQRGKRLEKFLKEKFPNTSWRARSDAIGLPDSTVIGWRKGRELSGAALVRLHELGCDLYWLLTGKGESPEIIPNIDPEKIKEMECTITTLENRNRGLQLRLEYALMKIGELNYRLGKSEENDASLDYRLRDAETLS